MADDFKAQGELHIDSNIPEIDKQISELKKEINTTNQSAVELAASLSQLNALMTRKEALVKQTELSRLANSYTTAYEKSTKTSSLRKRHYVPKGPNGTYSKRQLEEVALSPKDIQEARSRALADAKVVVDTRYANQDSLSKRRSSVISQLTSSKIDISKKEDWLAGVEAEIQRYAKKKKQEIYDEVVREFKEDELNLSGALRSKRTGRYTKKQLSSVKLDDLQLQQVNQEANSRFRNHMEKVEKRPDKFFKEKLSGSPSYYDYSTIKAIKGNTEDFLREVQELFPDIAKKIQQARQDIAGQDYESYRKEDLDKEKRRSQDRLSRKPLYMQTSVPDKEGVHRPVEGTSKISEKDIPAQNLAAYRTARASAARKAQNIPTWGQIQAAVQNGGGGKQMQSMHKQIKNIIGEDVPDERTM